jgi:dTDP-4-amino-4,6-dideoxygalactose transaminase
VAVSTLTFAASVYPVIYLGAEPVFIDSEAVTSNLDAALVEEYLDRSARDGTLPKALIAVHLNGQHADIDPIDRACRRHGVVLVEDAAESLGASYRGRETATTADYSLLSFNGNKIITTTGGGMVVARSADAIARMRKWATQSREPALEYLHREYGFNYRMSNVLAAIGRGQLQVLDERVRQRQRVAERYRQAMSDVQGFEIQATAAWGSNTHWLSVAYLDPDVHGVTPVDLIKALEAENIEARPLWRPMHMQPMFEQSSTVGGGVAQGLYERGICLPSSSSLSEESQDCVIQIMRQVFAGSAVPAAGKGKLGMEAGRTR